MQRSEQGLLQKALSFVSVADEILISTGTALAMKTNDRYVSLLRERDDPSVKNKDRFVLETMYRAHKGKPETFEIKYHEYIALRNAMLKRRASLAWDDSGENGAN